MKHALPFMLAGLLLASAGPAAAEVPQAFAKTFADKEKAGKPDVTYGRVKELTAGQKVVINVDDAIDKDFDLTDKDVAVKLAKGLKVGDPVKVTEHSVAGKTKRVEITRHSGGVRSRAEEKK